MSRSTDTLLIGSLSSAAAAVVINELWRPGAVIAAALTPIAVAVFRELFTRPVQRIQRPPRTLEVAGGPVRVYRTRPRWGVALALGVTAFALAGAALTLAEAVLRASPEILSRGG
jgi:hypothetical protein